MGKNRPEQEQTPDRQQHEANDGETDDSGPPCRRIGFGREFAEPCLRIVWIERAAALRAAMLSQARQRVVTVLAAHEFIVSKPSSRLDVLTFGRLDVSPRPL